MSLRQLLPAALNKAGQLSGKVGYPRFKSRKRGIGSFRLTGAIKVFPRHIQLPRFRASCV